MKNTLPLEALPRNCPSPLPRYPSEATPVQTFSDRDNTSPPPELPMNGTKTVTNPCTLATTGDHLFRPYCRHATNFIRCNSFMVIEPHCVLCPIQSPMVVHIKCLRPTKQSTDSLYRLNRSGSIQVQPGTTNRYTGTHRSSSISIFSIK